MEEVTCSQAWLHGWDSGGAGQVGALKSEGGGWMPWGLMTVNSGLWSLEGNTEAQKTQLSMAWPRAQSRMFPSDTVTPQPCGSQPGRALSKTPEGKTCPRPPPEFT